MPDDGALVRMPGWGWGEGECGQRAFTRVRDRIQDTAVIGHFPLQCAQVLAGWGRLPMNHGNELRAPSSRRASRWRASRALAALPILAGIAAVAALAVVAA